MGVPLDENSETDMEYKKALLVHENTLTDRITRPWLYNNFLYYNFTKDGLRARKALQTLKNHITKLIKKKMDAFKANNNTTPVDFNKKRMVALDLLVMAEHEGKIDMKGIEDEIATLLFGVSVKNSCSFN